MDLTPFPGKVRADAEDRLCSRYRSRPTGRGKAHGWTSSEDLLGLGGLLCTTDIDGFSSFRRITKSWSSRVLGRAESYTRLLGARPLVRAWLPVRSAPRRGQQSVLSARLSALWPCSAHTVTASPLPSSQLHLLSSAFAHPSIPVRVRFQICVTVPWAEMALRALVGPRDGPLRTRASARAWPAFPRLPVGPRATSSFFSGRSLLRHVTSSCARVTGLTPRL